MKKHKSIRRKYSTTNIPTNGNGSVSKGWLLGISVAVLIGVGGWWASNTDRKMSDVGKVLMRKGEDIAELKTNVSYIKDDMKELKFDVKQIRDLLMQQKGTK